MGRYFVKYDKSEENIRGQFIKLREDEKLFDVTLATDDGKYIKAHRIILSAESYLFSDIFKDNHDRNMLIYMNNVSSMQLQSIMDFVYNGEAFILEDELPKFMHTANLLKIKGVQEGFSNEAIVLKNEMGDRYHDKCNDKVVNYDEPIRHTAEHNDVVDTNEGVHDQEIIEQDTDMLVDQQIEQIIEQYEGMWRCKVCGKITTPKINIRNHAETHIEGLSNICNICNVRKSTRLNLRLHMTNKHKDQQI